MNATQYSSSLMRILVFEPRYSFANRPTLLISVKREEKEGTRLKVAGISEVPRGTQNGTSLLNPLTSAQLAGFFRGSQA